MGDEYCRRTDAVLGRFPRLHRVVDDILAEADDPATCYSDARELSKLCRQHNITLGLKRFQFALSEATFAGYVVGRNGVSADPKNVAAITHFPRPTNLTQMRSFMGLINQLGDFCTEIVAVSTPLRPLLRKGEPFNWNADHDAAFAAVKAALTSPPVLAHFGPQTTLCS